MMRWMVILLPGLFASAFQSTKENYEMNQVAKDCMNVTTEKDSLEKCSDYLEEDGEWNTSVTESWKRTADFERPGPMDLKCYLKPSLLFAVCTWKEPAAPTGAAYKLHYRTDDSSQLYNFTAGKSPHCTIGDSNIYLHSFISVWVESCVRGCCYASQNITLRLNDSVKYDPPKKQTFSKSNGTLTIKWESEERRVFLKEARYKMEGAVDWIKRPCIPQENNNLEQFDSCNLEFEKNTLMEIQLRLKMLDGASLWSEWSDSIHVPAEIVESPALNYSVGPPSRSGHRKLNLQWEESKRDEGNVSYTISAKMVACPCEENNWPVRGTQLTMNISEAAYNISIYAANEAGASPSKSYIIKSHPHTGTPFLNVTLSGVNGVHVWWTEKKTSAAYCIEWQSTSKIGIPGDCDGDELESGHYNGTVESKTCYRIAIYGYVQTPKAWNTSKHIWKTLGSTYYYKPSKEEETQHIMVSGIGEHSAMLRWADFLLDECRSLLQNYTVTIYPSQLKDTTKARVERVSDTVYNITNLTAGTEYTIEIKGETLLGEETGSSRARFRTLNTAQSIALWRLLVTSVGILLTVVATAGLWLCGLKGLKKIARPEVPTPADSAAIKFSQVEMGQVKDVFFSSRQPDDLDHADPLIIVPNIELGLSLLVGSAVKTGSSSTEVSKDEEIMRESTHTQPSLPPQIQMEAEDLPTSYKSQHEVGRSRDSSELETDPDANDLPFSYKKQMVVALEEGSQEGQEELMEVNKVGVQDTLNEAEAENWQLLEDKCLYVAGSNPKTQGRVNVYSTD